MNLYKLALEIQGGVDNAFGDSISVAQKHLNGLEKEIKKYQAYLAAYMASVKPEFIMALPAADFNLITLCIQRFLPGSG